MTALAAPHPTLLLLDAYQRSNDTDNEANDKIVVAQLTKAFQSTTDNNNDNDNNASSIAMIQAVDCILASSSKSNTDTTTHLQLMQLIASVTCAHGVLVPHLLMCTTVVLERVRRTACCFLGCIVRAASNNEASTDSTTDTMDTIASALAVRCTDKATSVRRAAVVAAHALLKNDADDNYYELQRAVARVRDHDSSAVNRAEALLLFGDLDATLIRLRDLHPKVRAAAKRCLLSNSHSEWHAEQMAHLLDYAQETNDDAAATEVVHVWMQQASFNVLTLLRRLDVVEFTSQAEYAIRMVVQLAESNNACEHQLAYQQGLEEATIQIGCATAAVDNTDTTSNLGNTTTNLDNATFPTYTPEQLFLARVRNADHDVTVLCRGLDCYMTRLRSLLLDSNNNAAAVDKLTFMCSQILQLSIATTDLEEGSRRYLQDAMKRLLASILTPEELVPDAVQVLRTTATDNCAAMPHVLEIVTELEAQMHAASAEAHDNYVLRVLTMLDVVLEHETATPPHDVALRIVPVLSLTNTTTNDNDDSDAQQQQPLIRVAAVSCLGKLGLVLDRETVRNEYMPRMVAIASAPHETVEVRTQALLAVSDWAVLGLTPLSDDVKRMIHDIMSRDDEERWIKCVAAEVAAKWLFSELVLEPTWLAQLVLFAFHSTTQDDDDDDDAQEIGSPTRLQQLLSAFFPAFSLKSRPGRDCLLASVRFVLERLPKKMNRNAESMIIYICDMVNLGDNPTTTTTASDDDVAESTTTANAAVVSTNSIEPIINNKNDLLETSVELSAALQMATFVSRHHDNIARSLTCTLCKMIAIYAQELTLEEEPVCDLVMLKQLLEELGTLIADKASLNAIKDCLTTLDDVHEVSEVEDDIQVGLDADEAALEDEALLEEATIMIQDKASVVTLEDDVSIDKENEPTDRRVRRSNRVQS
jgi:hypothetical protein